MSLIVPPYPQSRGEVRRSAALGHFCDPIRSSRGDHPPACVTSTRSQVDHPVGACDNPHVVLGHHHGVARVDEAMQLTVQQIHVRGMQAVVGWSST
jgi:hypothetical protein